MITLKKALEKAIKTVNEENLVVNWGNLAEKEDGSGVWADDPEACRWCLIGHIKRYKMSHKQNDKYYQITKNSNVNLTIKHTPTKVKAIYRNWLRKLEKLEASK